MTTGIFADVPPLALGLLRLACSADIAESDAIALLHFAYSRGIRIFDTADCYFHSDEDRRYGEHLLRDAFSKKQEQLHLITKVGLTRHGNKWIPNGEPEHIAAAVEESRAALGVDQISLVQLHARDPSVPFEKTLTALAKLQTDGVVAHVGLCNVTPADVQQAQGCLPIASIQNEISFWNHGDAQRVMVELCAEHGIPLLAFRPLNAGKRRARGKSIKELDEFAKPLNATREQAALAWVRSLGEHVIPLFGATQMKNVRSSCEGLVLSSSLVPQTSESSTEKYKSSEQDLSIPKIEGTKSAKDVTPVDTQEVLIVMGIQGSGKSEFVEPFVKHGYKRLNRDLQGGSLADLLPKLDRMLAGGASVVLDNTYPSRQSRQGVLGTARKYHTPVRCLHIQTPLHEAHINVVLRMIQKYGLPLGPQEMEMMRKVDPNLPPPQALVRWLQAFEQPTTQEGFATVVEVPFQRRPSPAFQNKAVLLDVDGTVRTTRSGEKFPRHPDDVTLLPNRREVLSKRIEDGYQLFFVSNQAGIAGNLTTHDMVQLGLQKTAELLELPISEITYCPHPARPIGCFCRKPLPGLGVYLMQRHQLDLSHSIMVGDRDSDAEFARNLGVDFSWADDFFEA